MSDVAFKITVEFYCYDMIDGETFIKDYDGDAMLAYKFISDNFNDSPLNFSSGDKIVKVEVLRQPEKNKKQS
jgi:hypothetical protein